MASVASVIEPELPQGNGMVECIFDVIFHDEGMGQPFDLLVALFPSTNLKRIVLQDEIGNLGGNDILIDPHLIEKEGLPNIADVGLGSSQLVAKIGVV